MNLPSISLIILNYNGLTITPTILNSIPPLNYPAEKVETLVLDNASTDGSVEMIRKDYPFVKIVSLSQNRAYAAFNQGVLAARGEYCFLLNNDIELHPDCLRELVGTCQRKKAVVAAPAVYDLPGRRLMYTRKYVSHSFYNGSDYLTSPTDLDNQQALEESYTGVPFIKTSFARQLPYVFDPDYFLYVEDVDLAFRLRLVGQTIHRSPRAIVYHSCNATTKLFFTTARQSYLIERNCLQTFLKNLQWTNIIIWSPFFFAPRLLKLAVLLVSLRFTAANAILRAWWWNCRNFGKTWKKRRWIQSHRTVSDSAVFSKMGGEINVLKYMVRKRKSASYSEGHH